MERNDPQFFIIFNVLNEATKAIQKQIEFTRLYQDLGIQEPAWLSPASIIREMRVPEGLTLDLALEEIVIFADPMLEKVFHNLLDNSIRHGETVSHIRVSGAGLRWICNCPGRQRDGTGMMKKKRYLNEVMEKTPGLGCFLPGRYLPLQGLR